MNDKSASPRAYGVVFALGSAALFGASIPVAKLLIGNGIDSWLLAGLLYLGSGIGLTATLMLQHLLGASGNEAPLRGTDAPRLGLVIAIGGVAAPVLLMWGLTRTDAVSASLLLNLEGVGTLAIAWLVFRENTDWRIVLGAVAILAGAVLVSWNGRFGGVGLGTLAIVAACVAWAVDNNLTRRLSGADPIAIAAWKGLAAGTVNLLVALSVGTALPHTDLLVAAGLVGLLGYGSSLVLFVLALRYLGVARTGAYYSTAPFVGAAVAVLLLGEPFTLRLAVAGLLMAFGVWLHMAEVHAHRHRHEALDHEHRHTDDEHHTHGHASPVASGVAHSHRHRHDPGLHSHEHYPDLHHRHEHDDAAR